MSIDIKVNSKITLLFSENLYLMKDIFYFKDSVGEIYVKNNEKYNLKGYLRGSVKNNHGMINVEIPIDLMGEEVKKENVLVTGIYKGYEGFSIELQLWSV